MVYVLFQPNTSSYESEKSNFPKSSSTILTFYVTLQLDTIQDLILFCIASFRYSQSYKKGMSLPRSLEPSSLNREQYLDPTKFLFFTLVSQTYKKFSFHYVAKGVRTEKKMHIL